MKTKTILSTLIAILVVIAFVFQSCEKVEEENQPPTCKITSPTNGQIITKGATVIISVEANDSDGSITEVLFAISGVEKGSASSYPYNYNWSTNNESIGFYAIKTTSVDNNGSITSDEIIVTIVENGGNVPVVDFLANITNGNAPLSVSFTDQSANNPTTWQWNFGDGGTSTQQSPSHTFNNAGTYSVTLTSTNEYGSDTETKSGYITVNESGSAPAADFNANITSGTVPLSVNFTDQSTNNPTSWQWNLGDGGTSTQSSPSHTYSTDGSYTVILTVSNSNGTDTESKINYIVVSGSGSNTPPTALFTVSPSSGSTSTNFAFDASGSTDNEDPTSNLQVRWDFDGNGSWDTGWDYNKTVNHQYGSENTYTAKLEVKDTEGLTDQYTKSITVSNGGGGNGCEGQTNLTYGGQTYELVEIGNQCWMAENLNYETTNSWWYDNSSANGDIYGRLYNWEGALTACPSGWSLPSDNEWTILSDFLGGENIAGEKMKATSGWYNNGNGTNSSGFNAFPGGNRSDYDGLFSLLGSHGYWWTSAEYSGAGAWFRSLHYLRYQLDRGIGGKADGFSVRCLKD